MKVLGPISAVVMGAALALAPSAAHASTSTSTYREAIATFTATGAIDGVAGNQHVVSLHAYVDQWDQYVDGSSHDWTCPVGKLPPATGKASNGCVDQGSRSFLAGSLPFGYSSAGTASVAIATGLGSAAVSGTGRESTGIACGSMVCYADYRGAAVQLGLSFTATGPALSLPTLAEGSVKTITARTAKFTGTFQGLAVSATSAQLKRTDTTSYYLE